MFIIKYRTKAEKSGKERTMKHLLKIGYILIPYFVLELLQYVLLSAVILVKGVFEISGDLLYLMSASITAVCGLVFFLWYRYETKKEALDRTGALLIAKSIPLLTLLGIGCQFFFSGFMSLIRPFFEKVFSDYAEVLESLTDANIIVALFFMVIVAPVSEELIFRGVILHRGGSCYPFWPANILQAVLFGVYHANLVQGIYAALIGLILGAVCHKFGSIYASIALHMIINASSLLMALIPDKLISHIIVMAAGAGFMALSLILIDKTVYKKFLQ